MAILTLTKSWSLKIMGELADEGQEGRAKGTVLRYFNDPTAAKHALASTALADLGDTRLTEIKNQLGNLGRGKQTPDVVNTG